MKHLPRLSRILAGLCASVLLLCSAAPVFAASESVVRIYDYDDLMAARSQSGSYLLMNDIDFSGKSWTPWNFSGTFDGNHHAFLNMTVTDVTQETRTTYDGNMKTYDTCFSGVFGILEHAEIRDLTVLGLRIDTCTDRDCFIGGLAGYTEQSTLSGCTLEGKLSHVAVASKMFGVGGMVGFGNGLLQNCQANVQLVCVDRDKEHRDEQFMGGAYAAGYLDVEDCQVSVTGYDSDHGYVHNGGLVGMYALYPKGTVYAGRINRNRVEGVIHFFEDNTDRRAYCSDFCGEVLNWTYEFAGNSSQFTRDEVYQYEVELGVHSCQDPQYALQGGIDSTCTTYGHRLYVCQQCNSDSYRVYLPLNHTPGAWETEVAATETQQGLKSAPCTACGARIYEKTPVLEPEPEPEPTPVTPSSPPFPVAEFLLIVGAGCLLLAAVLYLKRQREKKRQRRERRPKR